MSAPTSPFLLLADDRRGHRWPGSSGSSATPPLATGDRHKRPIAIAPSQQLVGSTNPGAGLRGFGLIIERAHLPCALVLQRRDVGCEWLSG